MTQDELSSEPRELMRSILERKAYRLLLMSSIQGHAVQLLASVSEKRRFAKALDRSLSVLGEVDVIHRELFAEDVVVAVRPRLEQVQFPSSRIEVAVCLVLTGRADRIAAEGYITCRHQGFAAVARRLIEEDPWEIASEEQVLLQHCAAVDDKVALKAYWKRWMIEGLMTLGRPGTELDRQTVELSLRSKSAAEVDRQYLDAIEPLRIECNIEMPALNGLGIELPEDLRGRFAVSGLHV